MPSERKSKAFVYENEKEIRRALRELCFYALFVVVTTLVAVSSRHLYMFYFNKAVETSFPYKEEFNAYSTIQLWYRIMHTKIITGIPGVDPTQFPDEDNNTRKFNPPGEKKSATHTLMKDVQLLGPPRLRQIRLQSVNCYMQDGFNKFMKECYEEYSSGLEDTSPIYKGTYFYTLDEAHAMPLSGEISTYTGAGYIKTLAVDYLENHKTLEELKQQQWIDRGTRVVVFELELYNENTELFDSVKFITEVLPTGGTVMQLRMKALKLNSVWTDTDYIIFGAAIIFYVMIVFYAIVEVRELKQFGLKTYLTGTWNYLDITIILLAIITFCYNIWHPIYLNNLLERYHAQPNEHHSLDVIVHYNQYYTNTTAMCAFFVWIKIFKYISFNKILKQLSWTMRSCSKDLLGFGTMFAIIFLAYALLGYLIFGALHPEFRNFSRSILTLLRLVLGDFDYRAMEAANRVLGPIYFISYILLVFFTIMNMFLAIIIDTFETAKTEIARGPSQLKLYIFKVFRKLTQPTCKFIAKYWQKYVGVHMKACCRRFWQQLQRERRRSTDQMLHEVFSEDAELKEREEKETPAKKPIRVAESVILKEYFEVVPSIKRLQELEKLSERVELLHQTLWQLTVAVREIMRKHNYS